MKRPPRKATPGSRHQPLSLLQGKDIIVLALSEWEGPRRIRQHLTEELLKKGNRVLFVEANFTLTKFLRKWNFEKLLKFQQGYREVKCGLYALSAPPFIPGGEFSSILSRINWRMARGYVRDAVKKLDFRDPILWIYAYNASSMVGTLDEQLSLYLCNDAFAQLHNTNFLQQRVTMLERELVAAVDGVITVSDKLTEEKRPYAKTISTVHHGVDSDLFGHLSVKSTDTLNFPRPILGYSGVIRHIIDLDLLEYVAKEKPEWSIVMVGPVTESGNEYYAKVKQLESRPNVHFLGPKSASELPRYISQFDVCLLPYTRGVVSSYYSSPLKFFEYLAAGKPIVSTVGPYVYKEDIVYNAEKYQDVVAAITKAMRRDTQSIVRKRKALARENSWQNRLFEIDSFLKSLRPR